MAETLRRLLKNRALRLGLIALAILMCVFLLLSREAQKPKALGLPEGLQLGDSTTEEVIKALGEPEIQTGDAYLFDSTSLSRKNEVEFSDGKLSFFREVITENNNRTISEVQEIYGTPQAILYNELSGGGYNLYIYPEAGIAYLGKPAVNTIFEIWHFSPTTYELFKQNYAQDFSEEPEEVHTL